MQQNKNKDSTPGDTEDDGGFKKFINVNMKCTDDELPKKRICLGKNVKQKLLELSIGQVLKASIQIKFKITNNYPQFHMYTNLLRCLKLRLFES